MHRKPKGRDGLQQRHGAGKSKLVIRSITDAAALRTSPEPRRQHVKLRRIGAAGGRLDVADRGEIALEVGEERGLGAALEDFREEGAAGGEDLPGEGCGR